MSRRGKAIVFFVLFISCMGIFLGTKVGIADFFQVEAASGQGVVTVHSLNVRKGPGAEYDPVTQDGKNVYLFKDDEVKILDEQNNFYKVMFTYNKKTVTGYCNKAFIKLITIPTPKATVKPTTKPTLKPTSPTSSVKLDEDKVPNATVKTSTKTVSGLKYTGKVAASALRVRTKASTSADELVYKNKKIRLYKGDKVTITQQKIVKGVVWYYVKFTYQKKTLKGYVLSDYIKLTFAETVKGKIYSDVKVYVRNTAGVSNDYLMQNDKKVFIKNGKSVQVLKEANANSKKWLRISFTYSGKKLKGYVLANLVAFQAESAATVTPSPSPTIKPTATPKVTIKPTSTIKPTPKVTVTVKPTATISPTTAPIVMGEVNNGPLNVRLGAGKEYDRLIYKGEYVSLPIGHTVQIMEEIVGKSENWYSVKFSYNDVQMKGYVMAQYVTRIEESPSSDVNIG
ncbi:MAG: SH3 domain-containing protein [Lachnospiraceae bacterium]|nr:SH3 domain-containing protein [Lachnospiraceae bacterium]